MPETAESPPPRRVSYVHSSWLIRAADRLPSNEGRASLVHKLTNAFDLLQQPDMEGTSSDELLRAAVVTSIPATREELVRFHDPAFVGEWLSRPFIALGPNPDLSKQATPSQLLTSPCHSQIPCSGSPSHPHPTRTRNPALPHPHVTFTSSHLRPTTTPARPASARSGSLCMNMVSRMTVRCSRGWMST